MHQAAKKHLPEFRSEIWGPGEDQVAIGRYPNFRSEYGRLEKEMRDYHEEKTPRTVRRKRRKQEGGSGTRRVPFARKVSPIDLER